MTVTLAQGAGPKRARCYCVFTRGEQLHPPGFFKFVTHKEGIVLCLRPLFNVTPIQGGKSLQLLTTTKCTVAYVTELRRDDNFLQYNTIKETSLPICVSRGGSHIQFKATQWANVEESKAVISVPMRLTSTRLLQFSQARGPILWKSLGKQSCSMPAPQNAPSGSDRGLLVWSMSKVMVVSVRQLSKVFA